MDETGETQVSLSDPDARSMATTARMPRIVGYNVQTAVEADNHLIVTHAVTMLEFDRDALSMMAVAARDELTTDDMSISIFVQTRPQNNEYYLNSIIGALKANDFPA